MSSINSHDHDLLEAVVSMEEVKVAVWDYGSDKTPGRDGFSFAFVKRYWELLKSDIHEFVTTFFNTGSMPLGSNSSCITLIPKVSNPIHINDFRPLSLIGTHYKIIAKILANRLSNVVDNLVSHEQSSFTSGRQILDGPLMLNEMIDFNRFFLLEQDKDCLIRDRFSNGHWCWSWSRFELGIRNSAYLRDMLSEISHVVICSESDSCVWSLANDGVFSVSVTRRHIDDHLLPTLNPLTTCDKINPRKVNIFMWHLSLDRLPHRLNLSSRGIEILEISFPSCNGNVESNHHIFFECDIATDIWRLVLMWCNTPMPLFVSND
ncbi:RNA-directed DNA polymerase, eukaryota [Tanacetum coccineum]